jgi:polyhydroxyalkanoate synthesis regulator phasin
LGAFPSVCSDLGSKLSKNVIKFDFTSLGANLDREVFTLEVFFCLSLFPILKEEYQKPTLVNPISPLFPKSGCVIILYGRINATVATMTNPVLNSFFIGRALAESLNDKLGETLSYTLGELGKLNAEQGEKLRQFTQEVLDRAARETNQANGNNNASSIDGMGVDLQETIDELRAEIARLRAEIQRYRNQV